MIYLWHAWYILVHKWWVFVCGLSTQTPLWRLVIHDLSKFLPSEFVPMARWMIHEFKNNRMADDFRAAVNLHYARNDHHWQHWSGSIYDRVVLPAAATRDKALKAGFHCRATERGVTILTLPMPESAVREMVADWMAATYRQHGRWPDKEWWPWLETNWVKMDLHPETAQRIVDVLSDVNLWPRQRPLEPQNGS